MSPELFKAEGTATLSQGLFAVCQGGDRGCYYPRQPFLLQQCERNVKNDQKENKGLPYL